MATTSDKTDSFIEMVLGVSGRVRPSDLSVVDQPQRVETLRDYYERHRASEAMYLTDLGELVLGEQPAESVAQDTRTVTPVEPAPVGLGSDELDSLLGDYDGGTQPEPETPVAQPVGAVSSEEDRPRAVARSGAGEGTGRVAEPEQSSRTWLLWWIPTLALPLIGGLVAWLALRRTRFQVAQAMFAVGIVAGMIASILFLRYAEPLAAFVTGASRSTTIIVPSSTATASPGGQSGPDSGRNGSGHPAAVE